LTEESSPLAYSNGHSDHQNMGSLLAQNLNLMPSLPAKDEEEKKLLLFFTILDSLFRNFFSFVFISLTKLSYHCYFIEKQKRKTT
jgi:hypothetical protein